MSVKLYLDTESSNVDRSGYLFPDASAISMTRQINGRGTLSFTMRGPYATLQPDLVPGLGVLFQQPTGTSLFGGVIDVVEETSVVEERDTDTYVVYRVDCISYASWLDRRIIRKVYENQTVGAIMDDLIGNWIGSGATDDDGFSEGTITTSIHNTTIPRIEALYVPVSQVLDEIAKLTGGVWSVSATKAISIKTLAGGSLIPDRNLISSNQGFETGDFTGWSTWGTPDDRTIPGGAGTFWEGTYGYYHQHASGADNGSYRSLTGIVTGDTIVCSVYCKCISTAGSPNGIRLEISDSGGDHTAYASATGAWARLSVALTAASDAPVFRIGGQGECYFDATQVEYDVLGDGYPSTYTTTDAFPKDGHGISVRKDRDRYFNRVYLLDYQKRTDKFTGDGTTRAFSLPYTNIAKPIVKVGDPDGSDVYKRTVDTDFDNTFNLVTSVAGQEFANQPSSETISVVSSDAGDTTQTVTIIGVTSSGIDNFDTVTLNGTTAVQTTKSFTKVLGVKLDAACAGTVSVSGYGTGDPITSIADGLLSSGVYSALSNNTSIWVAPYYVSSGATTAKLGVKANAPGGVGTIYYAIDMTGTTPVLDGSPVIDVDEIYLGEIPAAQNITVYAQYEWEYAEDSQTLQQNTNSGICDAIGSGSIITVEYHGLRLGEIERNETNEQSARATAEGGSGIYEHVESLDDNMSTGDAQYLGDEMLDFYARDGATSYFPRVVVEFATWDSRFRTPGDRFVATLAKHAISATTFYIESVTMQSTVARADTDAEWEYRVKLVSGRVYGDWAEKFKAMLPTRRTLYRVGRLLPL